MKINNNCARKILFEIEKLPFNETISIENLQKKITEYSIEDVLNVITYFNQEHYVILSDKNSYEYTNVLRDNKIQGLSEKGYKSLDVIRDDEIWDEIKNKLPNFDDISIFSIIDLATKIYNNNQNKLFNIPDIAFFSRW